MRYPQSRPGASQRGFTMVELVVVVSIIMIFVGMARPIYRTAMVGAREQVLRENLHTLRQLIDEYTRDKNEAPQSLDDLVSAGYLKQLPEDPFTQSNTTWQAEMDDSVFSPEQTKPGIVDVKSGSDQTGVDGTPYNTW